MFWQEVDAPGASGEMPEQLKAPNRLEVIEYGEVSGLPPVFVMVYVKTIELSGWVIVVGEALKARLKRAPENVITVALAGLETV